MKTIKELQEHELTQWSDLPALARRMFAADDVQDAYAERDAVETVLVNATNAYKQKIEKLLQDNKVKRFVESYGSGDFLTVSELYDSAYTNAGDTCADYGIDWATNPVFYNYVYESMTHSQLEMDIDQFAAA